MDNNQTPKPDYLKIFLILIPIFVIIYVFFYVPLGDNTSEKPNDGGEGKSSSNNVCEKFNSSGDNAREKLNGGNAGEKLKKRIASLGEIEDFSISQNNNSIIVTRTNMVKITHRETYLPIIGLVCSIEGANPGILSGISEIVVLNCLGDQGYVFNGGPTECLREFNILENLKGKDFRNRDEAMEAIKEGSKKQEEYILSLTQFRNGM